MGKDAGHVLEGFVALLELLNADPQPDVVVRALVRGFLNPYSVSLASLHVVTPPDGNIRMIGAYGMSEDANERFLMLDPDVDLPVPHVLRTNRVLQTTGPHLLERFPALRPDFAGNPSLEANEAQVIFTPVLIEARPAAVFGFTCRGFDMGDRMNLISLQGLTAALSLWLARHHDTWSMGVSSAPGDGTHPIALTPRQRAILELVAQGWTNARIAIELDCSRSTIKQEIQRIMFALAADSRSQAVERARVVGLLPTTTEPVRDSAV